jgi:hypothetical protein
LNGKQLKAQVAQANHKQAPTCTITQIALKNIPFFICNFVFGNG